MYVTLRMPASAARQLNLAADDEQEEVTVRLTPMELAGRLTVSTGQVVTPESVIGYCRAWSVTRAAWRALVNRYGFAHLVEALRAACGERRLWLPEGNLEVVAWVRLALENHLLASELGLMLAPKAAFAWGYQLSVHWLAEQLEKNFADLYLWQAQLQECQGPQMHSREAPGAVLRAPSSARFVG